MCNEEAVEMQRASLSARLSVGCRIDVETQVNAHRKDGF